MKFGYVIVYVEDVERAVDFYERAFGFQRSFVHESGQFAQMATGETALSFTSHELGEGSVPIPYRKIDPSDAPCGFEFTFVSEDVAAAYSQALSEGAIAIAEPHEMPWGQTVCYVRDLLGVLVAIGSPLG